MKLAPLTWVLMMRKSACWLESIGKLGDPQLDVVRASFSRAQHQNP